MRSPLSGALAALAALVGTLAAWPAAAADPPPAASSEPGTTTIAVPAPDHRVEVTARAGLQLPGEVTPKGLLVGKTGPAPAVFAEVASPVHPFFTVGGFAYFSSSDYKQTMNDQPVNDGGLSILSLGGSLKARIPTGDSLVLRLGLLAGANFLWASSHDIGQGSGYSAHGAGLELGLTAECAKRLSQSWGLSGQLAFIAQPGAGSVSIDGESHSHDLLFAPIFFLAVGPEFYN